MASYPNNPGKRDQHYFHGPAEQVAPPHFCPLPGAEVERVAPPSGAAAAAGSAEPPMADRTVVKSQNRADEHAITIELGRAQLPREAADALRPGVVVPLDGRGGDPVDVLSDGRLVARGEVVVIDGHFCVRVTELFATARAA